MAHRQGIFLALGVLLMTGCGLGASAPPSPHGPFYLTVRAGAQKSWRLPLPESPDTPGYIKRNADVYPEDTAALHTWVDFTPWGIAWAAAPTFTVQHGVWLPSAPSAIRISPYTQKVLNKDAKKVATVPDTVTLQGKSYWVTLGGLSYQGNKLIYTLHTVTSLGAPKWSKTYRVAMAKAPPRWQPANAKGLKKLANVALPPAWTVHRSDVGGKVHVSATSPDMKSRADLVLQECSGCGLPQPPPSFGPSPFYRIAGGFGGWHQVPGGELQVGPGKAAGTVTGRLWLNGPGIAGLTVTVPKGEKGLMMAILQSFRR